MIKEEKSNYVKETLLRSSNPSKNLWTIINTNRGSKVNNINKICMLKDMNHQNILDPEDIARIF